MGLSPKTLAAAVLAAVLLSPLPALPQGAPPRVVAIGDVHGAYDELVELLVAAGLTDATLRWRGGDSQLVLLGDLLDRGARSREVLELVMALAEDAPAAGGAVELVLGNHEVMNLLGDMSYVTAEELAAYAPEEPGDERAAAERRFIGSGGADPAVLATEFARRYPPGFFAHRAAFAPTGRYGAWLLERPVIATRGRTAFVHGGLPRAAIGKTAAQLNREARDALRGYVEAVASLRAAGALYVESDFREYSTLAARFVAENPALVTPPIREAAERLKELPAVLGGESVFWYRGSVACSPALERARLAAGLAALDVERLVIGHTPTPGGRALSRFAEMLIRADTGMLRSVYGGRAIAIVIDGERVAALDGASGDEEPLEEQPRAVGLTATGGDDELERWLQDSPIVMTASLPGGALEVQLATPAGTISASFRPAPRRNATDLPEVAAYRLDRLLGLDVVPVAVRRTIDGRVGTLQIASDALPTESERLSEQAADAWCPLPEQFNSMYVLDALIGNDARSRGSMRYRPDGWQLVLTGHETSFGPRGELPSYLRRAPVVVPADLAARLRSLTETELERSIGDVLGAGRRAAVFVRRDRLLAL